MLQFEAEGGGTATLADSAYDSLANKDVTETEDMKSWLRLFQERYDVFFSKPLDLDFSLLNAFPDVYKGLATSPRRGPQLPEADSPDYAAAIDARVRQVLADNLTNVAATLGSTYNDRQRKLFPWYKYLFLDGSKPVAHMRAMIQLDSPALVAGMPKVLKGLVERAQVLAKVDQAEKPDGTS